MNEDIAKIRFINFVLDKYRYRLIPENAKYCWVSASTTRKKYIYISLKCTLQDGKGKTKNLRGSEEIELARIEVLIFRYKEKIQKAILAYSITPSKSILDAAINVVCKFFRELFDIRRDKMTSFMNVSDAIELMKKIGFLEGESKEILLWLEEKGCINLHPAPATNDEILKSGIETDRGVLYYLSYPL